MTQKELVDKALEDAILYNQWWLDSMASCQNHEEMDVWKETVLKVRQMKALLKKRRKRT